MASRGLLLAHHRLKKQFQLKKLYDSTYIFSFKKQKPDSFFSLL